MATSISLLTPAAAVKGRGSVRAVAHRFAADQREPFDDGWGQAEPEDTAPPPATQLRWEDARSAIAYNDSPDIGFDRSINPYRGCEHVMEREKLRAWR